MSGATTHRKLKRMGWILLGVAVLLLAVGLVALSSARVEMTANGVHTRLMVPVGRAAIGVPIYSGSGENVAIPDFLAGPVVRRHSDGSWSAHWFCENTVEHATGDENTLQITCAGKIHAFPLASAPVAPAVGPMPEQLVVLSDIEGNNALLESVLLKRTVVDASGKWNFGAGHLVILGDSVDRGRDVFAVLWRLHGLAAQAHAAGGAVHVLLGNHEQYLLRGNISRAHPEYLYALQQLGGYAEAFDDDSVLGQWLRSQPVVVKLGSVVFVHAGISPQVVASGLTIDQLNAAMRDYWSRNGSSTSEVTHSPALEAVLGLKGVTQYRGYFRESKDNYPLATQAHVDKVLSHFGADTMVVAHTLVEKVTYKYDDKVIAVDVNDPDARSEVLTYSQGTPHVIDTGIIRGLQNEPSRRLREFSLFNADDRHLLVSIYRVNRMLSRIPHPY